MKFGQRILGDFVGRPRHAVLIGLAACAVSLQAVLTAQEDYSASVVFAQTKYFPIILFGLALAVHGLGALRWKVVLRTVLIYAAALLAVRAMFLVGVFSILALSRMVLIGLYVVSAGVALVVVNKGASGIASRLLGTLAAIALLAACGYGLYGVVNIYDYTENAPASAPPADERECPQGPVNYRTSALAVLSSCWLLTTGMIALGRREELDEDGLTSISTLTR